MHATHSEQKIQNITVVGRDGVGKSKLIDTMLHIKTQGKGQKEIVELPEEKLRNYTLYNRFYNLELHGYSLNFIDTPGNTNFLPKVNAALYVSSGTLMVVSATGVSDASFRIWQSIIKYQKPKAIFINMLDHPLADFERTLHQIEAQFKAHPTVLYMPYFNGGELQGVVDILQQKLITGSTGHLSFAPIPPGLRQQAQRYYEHAVEELADLDDDLLERYLTNQEITFEHLRKILKKGVIERRITPILTGCAKLNIGMEALDTFLEWNFPAHCQGESWIGQRSQGDETPTERQPIASEPFSAISFKTLHSRYAGKLTFLLVVSGQAQRGDKVLNASTGQKFTLGRLNLMSGSHLEELQAAMPGDVIVLEKESHLDTNQTLCDPQNEILYPPIPYPAPRSTFAIRSASTKNDERLLECLHKLTAEDPSLRVERHPETGELLFSGMGTLHLEVARQHLLNLYDIKMELAVPTVRYREALGQAVEVRARHKKQSGGHGQYGDVIVRFEPRERGAGFEFHSQISGGAIPKTYIPAVETGIKRALEKGALGGYPVVDVKATLLDGSHHSVDSSELAFQLAGALAVRMALPDSKPILLEPIMHVTVDIPEYSVGSVSKDLTARRGKILAFDTGPQTASLEALIPLSEMHNYSTALRQLTQGLGLFSMAFKYYQAVTSHLRAKVLDELKGA